MAGLVAEEGLACVGLDLLSRPTRTRVEWNLANDASAARADLRPNALALTGAQRRSENPGAMAENDRARHRWGDKRGDGVPPPVI